MMPDLREPCLEEGWGELGTTPPAPQRPHLPSPLVASLSSFLRHALATPCRFVSQRGKLLCICTPLSSPKRRAQHTPCAPQLFHFELTQIQRHPPLTARSGNKPLGQQVRNGSTVSVRAWGRRDELANSYSVQAAGQKRPPIPGSHLSAMSRNGNLAAQSAGTFQD